MLDRALIGPCYFDDEKVAEVLAGEIMMLAETGFTIHGFGILPNHAHLMLRLPARSGLSFAKALNLLHVRTGKHYRRLVRPKLPPQAAAPSRVLAARLAGNPAARRDRVGQGPGPRARQRPPGRAAGAVSGVAVRERKMREWRVGN